jgi:hypothetical protein
MLWEHLAKKTFFFLVNFSPRDYSSSRFSRLVFFSIQRNLISKVPWDMNKAQCCQLQPAFVLFSCENVITNCTESSHLLIFLCHGRMSYFSKSVYILHSYPFASHAALQAHTNTPFSSQQNHTYVQWSCRKGKSKVHIKKMRCVSKLLQNIRILFRVKICSINLAIKSHKSCWVIRMRSVSVSDSLSYIGGRKLMKWE